MFPQSGHVQFTRDLLEVFIVGYDDGSIVSSRGSEDAEDIVRFKAWVSFIGVLLFNQFDSLRIAQRLLTTIPALLVVVRKSLTEWVVVI